MMNITEITLFRSHRSSELPVKLLDNSVSYDFSDGKSAPSSDFQAVSFRLQTTKDNNNFDVISSSKSGSAPREIILNTPKRSIDEQLKEMLLLEDGWLDGNGLAPSSQGLHWLAGVFALHYDDSSLPSPYLYPTEEGNVQIEWTLGAKEITIEIDLKSHSGFWHEMNFDAGMDQECVLDIDSGQSWNWMIKHIGESV